MTKIFTKTQCVLIIFCFLSIQMSFVHATKAPDVTLVRIDGVEQSMTDYIGQGKWVVVNVWSPSCTACVKELPELERFEQKHRNKIFM